MQVPIPPMVLLERVHSGGVRAVSNRIDDKRRRTFFCYRLIETEDHLCVTHDHIRRLLGNIMKATDMGGTVYYQRRLLRAQKFSGHIDIAQVRAFSSTCRDAGHASRAQSRDDVTPDKASPARDENI